METSKQETEKLNNVITSIKKKISNFKKRKLLQLHYEPSSHYKDCLDTLAGESPKQENIDKLIETSRYFKSESSDKDTID